MASEILIVADDLSGAADCAVSCAVRGLHTEVVIDRTAHVAADVIAVDADTRHQTPDAAAAETGRVVRQFGRAPWCYKKIDSTLRGNAGPEIAAALAARRAIDHRAFVIMAPAFPATGRTTVGGHQLVGGVPLERTEHWSRERTAADAHVGRMLERAGLRTALADLAAVRQGAERLAGVMAERAATNDAIVCDAETDDDLGAIAAAAARFTEFTVWAGSGGLATYLPDAARLTRARTGVAVPPARGPILFVIGSPSSMSAMQTEALASEHGVVTIEATAIDEALGAIASGVDVIVRPASVEAAGKLAPVAARASGLVLTGGETARAVLTAMGVPSLRLIDEVERGVPRSLAAWPAPLPIITKAGAFGDRLTLVRSRAALRNVLR